ncbi:MAG: hypothetical protein ACKO0Z_02910 [Betaproteobacteria bacterium]
MMISKVYEEWTLWFAWYPIYFTEYDEDNYKRLSDNFVWLEEVERKPKNTGGYWYRLPRYRS